MNRSQGDAARTSRRRFLSATAACFATAAAPRARGNAVAPSDRVRVGMVGCGMRAGQLLADMPRGAEVVAVSDCRLPRASELANRIASPVRVEQDYRRLLQRRDLDAVVICATDVHHVQAAILACQAGLDAYVEKPLSMYVREGRALVDAANRYGRIIQTGSQQRSMAINRYACELVRDGGIGDVMSVDAVDFDDAAPCPPGGLPESPTPSGLDWDLWLGPAEARPYHESLARHWRDGYPWWGGWRPYGGGRLTGLGSHALDMVQYALGKDRTGPTRIEFVDDENGDQLLAFRYEDQGPQVRLSFPDRRPYRGPRNGAVFAGSRAKIEINRNKVVSNPPEFVSDAPAPSEAVSLDRNSARGHLDDWLRSIRERSTPRADAEVGHRTATLCHLLAIAKRLGRGFRWDPVTEQVLGDPEAASMLDRPRRPGWELPVVS